MPIDGYFDTVFAETGDLSPVPDAPPGGGEVSYQQGYGSNYSLPLDNPSSLRVERAKMNQIFNDITVAIQQLQQFGTPPFITDDMNGGSPFSYAIRARVLSGGVVYTSLEDDNTTTPPSSTWAADTFTPTGSHSGYMRLPNGIIMQWLDVEVTGGSGIFSLPVTFPNQHLIDFVSYANSDAPAGVSISVNPSGASAVQVHASSSGFDYQVYVMSIGY